LNPATESGQSPLIADSPLIKPELGFYFSPPLFVVASSFFKKSLRRLSLTA
jgi:hypothetical protein